MANPVWCAASQIRQAVRNTPGRPSAKAPRGAAIQPIRVSVARAAGPTPRVQTAASAPETGSGRRASSSSPRRCRTTRGAFLNWSKRTVTLPHGGSRGPDRRGGTPMFRRTRPPRRDRDPAPEANARSGGGPARGTLARAGTGPVPPRGGPDPYPKAADGVVPSARLDDLPHDAGGLARGAADADADLLQGLLLGLRRTGRAGDDRAGVAHGLALGRGEPGDVAHDRLGHVLLDEGGGPLLRVPADLTDQHDRLGLRVLLERLEGVDVRGADDRVATDPDAGGEADVPQLVHELVGERAGLGDQADRAGVGDVGRDDAGVRLPGRGDAGAVRADDPGL